MVVNKGNFIRLFPLICIIILASDSLNAEEKTSRKNFVFILVDDLGWTDLGCYGSTFYQTPNIDKLAQSGMLFTDAYASCPVCSPTRASIMTGKYPARLNITDWIPGRDPKDKKLLGPQDLHQLPLQEKTIAELLRENGYKTFFAGKWHLGGERFFPEDQGFDINKGGYHRGQPAAGYYSPYQNPKLTDGPEGEYLTDRLTDESMRFIESNKNHPFLLYLSYYTVHTPIEACKRFVEEYRKKAASLTTTDSSHVTEWKAKTKLRQDNPDYASMVHALDDNVGRLLKKLDDLNLLEETVVVFTSDNGGLSTLASPRSPTSNVPLRAGKGWCYEGGIRVPLLVSAPGITSPNSKNNVPVISTDFYHTILELAEIKSSDYQNRDGISLVPLLEGSKNLNREALYWHYPHYHGSTWTPGAAIRAGDWKLIEFYEEERLELYNLKDDIGEKHDLSKTYSEKMDELLKLLHKWQKDIGAQLPRINPAYQEK